MQLYGHNFGGTTGLGDTFKYDQQHDQRVRLQYASQIGVFEMNDTIAAAGIYSYDLESNELVLYDTVFSLWRKTERTGKHRGTAKRVIA
jgi:hypothetical protein